MREVFQMLFRQKYRIAGLAITIFAFLAAWITSQRVVYRAEAKLLVADAQNAAEREYRIHYAAETLASHRTLQTALGPRPDSAHDAAAAAEYDGKLARLAARFRVEAKIHSPVLIAALEADAPEQALAPLQQIVEGYRNAAHRQTAQRLAARDREVDESRKRLDDLAARHKKRFEQLGMWSAAGLPADRDRTVQRLTALENESAALAAKLAGAEAVEAASRADSTADKSSAPIQAGTALYLRTQRTEVERQIAGLHERLKLFAKHDAEYAEFHRDLASAEERHRDAVRSRDAARVADSVYSAADERIQILQDAVLAGAPGRSFGQFAFAALAALCAAMIVGVLCETLDATIRSPEQIEERLQLSMLASAPPMSRSQSLLLKAAAYE